MKLSLTPSIILIAFFISFSAFSQTESGTPKFVDIVWLNDGSKLTGTILEWKLSDGMDFKLITGARLTIAKDQIKRVAQEQPIEILTTVINQLPRGPKPYAFKEEGVYHNGSLFLTLPLYLSQGINYAVGHRFKRILGVGIGTGYESHESDGPFFRIVNFVPLYVEARGFFLPQKISPYYALKVGYGFALKENFGNSESTGGLYLSPELGMRFGSAAVNFYAGLEYKMQNARVREDFFGGGSSLEKISFRRVGLRTGLLF